MLASGMLLVAVLAFLSVMVLMSAWRQRRVLAKMPPGPTPLPFIGNCLHLDTEKIYNSLLQGPRQSAQSYTAFLLLLKNPDMHEDTDQVTGRNQQPQYKECLKMLSTEVVIRGIQTFVDASSLALGHGITMDTKFQGFLILKVTEVFPVLSSVLKDTQFFPDLESFNPQHFLDDKGKFKKSDAFIPFSVGKRYCFRDSRVKMEPFTFFITVMGNFCLKSPQEPLDIDFSS